MGSLNGSRVDWGRVYFLWFSSIFTRYMRNFVTDPLLFFIESWSQFGELESREMPRKRYTARFSNIMHSCPSQGFFYKIFQFRFFFPQFSKVSLPLEWLSCLSNFTICKVRVFAEPEMANFWINLYLRSAIWLFDPFKLSFQEVFPPLVSAAAPNLIMELSKSHRCKFPC